MTRMINQDDPLHPAVSRARKKRFIARFRPDIRLAGFTLIELLITLVVAGVLLSIAVPSMRTFILNARITTQANELLADLSVARSEAIKRKQHVAVCKSSNATASIPSCSTTAQWNAGRVIFVDANRDGGISAGEQIIRVRDALEGGNTITAVATNVSTSATKPYHNAANVIGFTSAGMSTIDPSQSGQLKLCDDRGAASGRLISIEPTGRPSVSKPTASFSC